MQTVEGDLKYKYNPKESLLLQDKIKNLLIKLLNREYFELEDPWGAAEEVCDWEAVGYCDRYVPDIRIEPFVPPLPIRSEFNKILNILSPHRDLFYGAYIHGSWATGSYVEGVSDIDMVCILNDVSPYELIALGEILRPTKAIFEAVDPGDHHGPYFMTRSMLDQYLESYLPIEVWKTAKLIFGEPVLSFGIMKSPYHDHEWFYKSIPFYEDAAAHPERYQTKNEIKKFTMMATMLPAVAYPHITGEYTTKQKAIEWMRAEYPGTTEWADELTRMRAEDDFTKAQLNETVEVCRIIRGW